MRKLSVAEARANFDQVMDEIRRGDPVEIVDGSDVVATIVPSPQRPSGAERRRILSEFLEESRRQPAMNLGRFDRRTLWDDILAEKGLP
ncbi:type II toxin-antitoxin system Phd/YefM family antitoxin [Prosthecomicrobium hirschii]|uniref:type II toxin-antitoxin system Phd/YefM family antitoxin n=1 Tax=Prosthecodimorpha hirschii TaxID=665126 RepID=UPI00221FDCD4|nr:hypothetical protein [Prosthecomicrobium hirschii]MCW1841804.1 hypothetical protein [Prosthecomicrobium hirschii]